MEKKKLTLIIIGTVLAMALVAALLVLWLVPAGNAGVPAGDNTGAVSDNQGGETGGTDETQDAVDATIDNGPTVGVEVENGGNSGNSGSTGNGGNTGNTGNGGNTGNTGNTGNGGSNEIDFDDLLGG